VAELIQMRDDFENQLHKIDSFDEEIELLKKQIDLKYLQLKNNAEKLTKSREEGCKPIENYLIEQLTKLGIPNIQFQIVVSESEDFSENGHNEVQFMFSANKNRSVQPVAQIASGGEVSRLMLAIKSLMAHKADLPTIIFDEIDTGVSGEIAHRMGEIMQGMSADMQVITITHLPQIAAKGKQHYKVFKDENETQTITNIVRLNGQDRLGEVAQMLSGKNVTEAALRNAEEMLLNN
jgi:DNA repair protein RecN (Recombination protein N)